MLSSDSMVFCLTSATMVFCTPSATCAMPSSSRQAFACPPVCKLFHVSLGQPSSLDCSEVSNLTQTCIHRITSPSLINSLQRVIS